MKSFVVQRLTFTCLLVAANLATAAAENSIPITPSLIDSLVVEAGEKNPLLGAESARVDAANASVEAVRTWEDPTATIEFYAPTSRGFNASVDGNLVYGLEQKLPLFDRPKLSREIAAADAGRQKLSLNYELAKVRRDVATGLIALSLADATVEFAEEDLSWLTATLAAVDHRYRVGKASQVEWLKIETERAKAIDQIRTLKLERDHQQVGLNRLLNRELHAPWARVSLLPEPTTIVAEETLISSALRSEPNLEIKRQEILQAQATARLTKVNRRPEVGIGLKGRSYTGDAGLRDGMVSVDFTVPWLNARRYDRDYARDRARTRASEQELAGRVLAIREEIHHLVIDWDAARRQTALYRNELIPLTEQTLSSASSAWANNLGPFQDLLDARRMLVENRLVLAQAAAEEARIRAELCFITGRKDLADLPQTSAPVENPMNMSEESK